ncbi:NAD(P)H-binding protein [Acinetobacter puyangensis]|uniref:Nucleoside-diphosphate-sugar epimerase n=1 Tax=Acinetobacter puyangensis TaxID=1096779 RepID=A0A240ECW0_9GAMM|nr:NAD-dependent epimerase/dehydratase family protein [Acinetobacter puyangensis]SNX46534.1 Nucleoside-diphosphate-sugar epimerase [Acinetobacter puyangensis]
MNVLILGCGQTGQALAQQLYQQGHAVTCVSRHDKQLVPIQHMTQDIHYLTLDSTPLFDWVYVILSPSQRNVEHYQQTFIDTARPVFSALQSHPIQRVIFISSTRVYGENSGRWIDDATMPYTNDPIGQCLIATEQLWSAYWQDKLTIIRPSGLYQANSAYLRRLAHDSQQITVRHWTNRIHRQDLIGFLTFLSTIKRLESSYLLSDQQPMLQSQVINMLREQDNLTPLVIAADLPETGKRINAVRFSQSGYSLKYPCFMDTYKKA